MTIESSPSRLTETALQASSKSLPPIILNLGKKKRKAARRLKKGKGSIERDVEEALEYAEEALGAEAAGKVFVPVVMIYKEKPKKRKNRAFGWY